MSLLWTPSEHVLEENAEWARMRAVEWQTFPAYLSQPVVPLLLLAFPWYAILTGLTVAVLVWRPIRGQMVSISLASAAMLFVSIMKWPLAGAMSVFFLLQGMWLNAVFSLAWPLLADLIPSLCPECPERLAVCFLRQMGYDIPDAPKRSLAKPIAAP